MVRISGGVNAMIHSPIVIFKNENRSPSIAEVPDSVPEVFYISSLKGCMDGTV